jgi:hypothetical protein
VSAIVAGSLVGESVRAGHPPLGIRQTLFSIRLGCIRVVGVDGEAVWAWDAALVVAQTLDVAGCIPVAAAALVPAVVSRTVLAAVTIWLVAPVTV